MFCYTAVMAAPFRAPIGLRLARTARVVTHAFERVMAEAGGSASAWQVLILVEWESMAAFESYRQDPALADLHPHRERGTSAYVWHLFDRLDDLRPLLRP